MKRILAALLLYLVLAQPAWAAGVCAVEQKNPIDVFRDSVERGEGLPGYYLDSKAVENEFAKYNDSAQMKAWFDEQNELASQGKAFLLDANALTGLARQAPNPKDLFEDGSGNDFFVAGIHDGKVRLTERANGKSQDVDAKDFAANPKYDGYKLVLPAPRRPEEIVRFAYEQGMKAKYASAHDAAELGAVAARDPKLHSVLLSQGRDGAVAYVKNLGVIDSRAAAAGYKPTNGSLSATGIQVRDAGGGWTEQAVGYMRDNSGRAVPNTGGDYRVYTRLTPKEFVEHLPELVALSRLSDPNAKFRVGLSPSTVSRTDGRSFDFHSAEAAKGFANAIEKFAAERGLRQTSRVPLAGDVGDYTQIALVDRTKLARAVVDAAEKGNDAPAALGRGLAQADVNPNTLWPKSAERSIASVERQPTELSPATQAFADGKFDLAVDVITKEIKQSTGKDLTPQDRAYFMKGLREAKSRFSPQELEGKLRDAVEREKKRLGCK